MATLTFYKPYDMSAPTLWIGPIVSYSSTHVTLSDGHYTGTVYGNFTFTSTGVSGGTVTGYEQSLDGVLELKLTDGNYSALAMLDFLLKGNLIGLLKFMIAGDDTVIGSNGNDILLGLIGDDILLGNLGDDTLNGGADSDWASYSSASGGVTVNLALAGAQNTVNAGSDTLLNMENLIGSDYGDTLIGNTFANTLKGGTGNDKLNGGSGGGADLLDGGEGSDWAYYDTAPSKVVVNLGIPGLQSTLGGGADQLLNIENLMGSHFNDTLIGNAADNKLNGGDGDDQLDGGLGDDILDGGAGSDWANYDNAAASVVINLAFTGIQNTLSAGSDKLLSIENVLGSGFDDLLLGNAADNNLKGGLGDDRLSGGLGNDDLNGGVGSDWVSYGPASGGVTVNLALSGPQNTVKAGSDTLISIENLIGSNYADTLIGNASANTLKGGTGNDKLNGGSGGGADLLDGDTGSDWAYYDTAPSRVVVNLGIAGPQNTLGAGADQLISIENLMGSQFNDILIGNAEDNRLNGGDGDDQLDGGLGDDILEGGAGSDWANYSNAAAGVTVNLGMTAFQDTVAAGSDKLINIENVLGSGFNDTLSGNSAANKLNGGNGDDVLNGGLGNDTLTGGSGRDTFKFTTAPGPDNIDTISLFTHTIDNIQLASSIFTSLTTVGPLPADMFINGATAGDANDFIVYDKTTGALFYDQDGSGGTAQVQIALLANKPHLTFNDIFVA